MKGFLAGLGTAALLAIGGFFFVTIGMPLLFPTKPSEVSVPAKAAPEVKRAPTKRVAVKAPVKVFEDKTKKDLKLPPAVIDNPDEHVIAATQVKGSDRPQTVTTVIDEKTGESSSFVKTDPYPWLAFENRAEVRMSYGYRYTPQSGILFNAAAVKPVGRLSFTYDALRVKALTLGTTAQIDTDGQAFVGVGAAYRW